MSTILNEKIFGIGRYSNRNLKKAEKKFLKADNKYVNEKKQAIKDNNGDSKTLSKGTQDLLDAKKALAKERAEKYDKIDTSIKERKTKKNEKIADKLMNKEGFAARFDRSKMNPELDRIYSKKLADRAEALSKGQEPASDTRSRVDERLKIEEGSKFLSLYDNFPILSESYNPAELKESYTHEDFAELILENVINAESLDTFQLLVLAESLGYEYLEEGVWNKINNAPGVRTGKKIVGGGLLALAALRGINGMTNHNTVRDLRANLGANTQEINTAKSGINKMKELQLQGYKIGIPDIGAEKESERLGSKVQELESKNRVISIDKAKATKKRNTDAGIGGTEGAAGLGLVATAISDDRKKKKEMEKQFEDKNDQIRKIQSDKDNEVKNLQDQLKAKQDAEAKKFKK